MLEKFGDGPLYIRNVLGIEEIDNNNNKKLIYRHGLAFGIEPDGKNKFI